jgi:hypothetical protein
VDPPSPLDANNDENIFDGGPSSRPPQPPSPSSPPRAKSTPTGRNPKKQKIVQKKIGPKKKLAYEMTYEEAKEHSCQAVKDHFIPKVPEKRVQIDALLAAKHYRRKKGKTTLRL